MKVIHTYIHAVVILTYTIDRDIDEFAVSVLMTYRFNNNNNVLYTLI